jgi:hypothetical protein
MKALCLVAHPDDCVIFAYSYIHNHPEHDWTIAYLTYTELDPRGAEMSMFWRHRGIDTIFLGFEDHWHDQEQQQFTRWNQQFAKVKCWELAKDYALILTHDQHGDYGHIHHQLVHDSVQRHCNVVTFAPHGQGTTTLSVAPGTYSLSELPHHSDIIASFHMAEHKNSYTEPKQEISP